MRHRVDAHSRTEQAQITPGVTHGVTNAQKIRKALRRLDRRKRKALPQVLPHKIGSAKIPRPPALKNRLKKSPRLGNLKAVVASWAEAHSPNRGQNNRLRTVAAELLRQSGDVPIHEITELGIASMLNRWQARYAPTTTFNKAAALRKFLKWLEPFGAPRSLREAVSRQRTPRPRQTTATAHEIAALRNPGPQWLRLFTRLTYDLAMRLSEASTLAPQNINPENNSITFRKKGGHTHTLPLTQEIRAILDTADASQFATPYIDLLAGRHLNPQIIHRAFKKALTEIGANPRVTIHDLRRTRITDLYTETKDLRVCQQLAGHSEMWTTAQYVAHLMTEDLRKLLTKTKPQAALIVIRKAANL